MHFLSNGDFGFPFTWPLFWAKQFYMWSYQTGTSNADGIIRMPSRLLDLLVFMLFGNVAFEYFFIFSSLIVAFVSFYYFSGKFLEVENRTIKLFTALFFTLNPIVLGNLSKIGLVLAAAMLPVCLVMIKQGFLRQRFRYFLLLLIFLNISLIHPYTFVVNLGASGVYFLWCAWRDRSFVTKSLLKFAAIAGTFVLLNAYFLLPIASMHTVSKGTLSNTVAGTSTDYTALVSVLNTGDIFTGLSLSKNVVKDYDFYNPIYQNIYFLGIFVFYTILFGIYMHAEKQFDKNDRQRFIVLLSVFLVLVILATVMFLHVDALIKLLIHAPGGWAFRSPLKWQLYIPLTLAALLAIAACYISKRRWRILLYSGILLTFILMNSYVLTDVYKKLLTPRSVTHFSTLQRTNLDNKNMLIVNSEACWSFEQDNPVTMNELNQVLISQNVQVKQVSASNVDAVNLNAYDYVLGCQENMQPILKHAYRFKQLGVFANNTFQLYANQTAHPYIYATTQLFTLPEGQQLSSENAFVTQVLHQNFNFTTNADPASSSGTTLQGIFDNLSPSNIRSNGLEASVTTIRSGSQTLYLPATLPHLYYRMDSHQISFAPDKLLGYTPVPNSRQVKWDTSTNHVLDVKYVDSAYNYKNLVSNPSLEQGLWEAKVGDCYNYDNNPRISMKLNQHDKTNGNQSLQLEAANHIACTSPPAIPVKPNQQYALSFDYQSPGGDGGYFVGFDSQDTTLGERLPATKNGWHAFSRILTTPANTSRLVLNLEAYPDGETESTGVARYDNVRLIAIPNVQHNFYLVGKPTTQLNQPAKVDFKVNNPTQSAVTIQGASAPFYLATRETYDTQWQLRLPSGGLVSNHFTINGTMNGWYIDPRQLCQRNNAGCTLDQNGSYNFKLTMEFGPQRWFTVGALISLAAFIASTIYLVRDIRKDKKVATSRHRSRTNISHYVLPR